MRSIKIKVSEGGAPSIQNPGVTAGFDGRVATFEITGVPDDMDAATLLKRFRGTTFMPLGAQRYVLPSSALGVGKIVWSLTTGQAAARVGLTDGRIRQLIAEGAIPSTMGTDGRHYIDPSDLDALALRPETRGRNKK